MRVCLESNTDLLIQSLALYLKATVADYCLTNVNLDHNIWTIRDRHFICISCMHIQLIQPCQMKVKVTRSLTFEHTKIAVLHFAVAGGEFCVSQTYLVYISYSNSFINYLTCIRKPFPSADFLSGVEIPSYLRGTHTISNLQRILGEGAFPDIRKQVWRRLSGLPRYSLLYHLQ